MIGAQDLEQGFERRKNVMEIDEVQCAKGGNVGRVSFQTQYMCGGQFEGVNMGSPLVSDAVTRVRERGIFSCCVQF